MTRHRQPRLLRVDRPPSSPLLPSSECLNADVDSPTIRSQLATDEKADDNSHRPEAGVGDLLEAAARFAGEGYCIHFGAEREKLFCSSRESQLIVLEGERGAPEPPEVSPNFTGGEHHVWIAEPPVAVIKHTLSDSFGRIPDERKVFDTGCYGMRWKLTVRHALPSEYLFRWALMLNVFGLPTDYLGRFSDAKGVVRMVVSQPYIDQDDNDPATIEDVEEFMRSYGFSLVDGSHVAIKEIANATWYRWFDGILVTDAHARNFRKEPDTGTLIPVDLMVTLVSKGESRILPDPHQSWQSPPPACD